LVILKKKKVNMIEGESGRRRITKKACQSQTRWGFRSEETIAGKKKRLGAKGEQTSPQVKPERQKK